MTEISDITSKFAKLVSRMHDIQVRGCHHDLSPTRMFNVPNTIEEAMQQEFLFYDNYMKSMDSTVRNIAKQVLDDLGLSEQDIQELKTLATLNSLNKSPNE